MKRVLFLINNLNRGGAERTFLRQIHALHDQGVPVFLGLLSETAAHGYKGELRLPAYQVVEFERKKSVLVQASRIIRSENIDIIYSTLELANIFARLLKIFHPHVRVFIREGSARIDASGAVSPKPLKYRIFDMAMNWAAEKIIAVSDEIATALKAYQPMYAHKITVLENGVGIADSEEAVKAAAEKKLKRGEFRILTAASMNYHERAYEYLIGALPLLPREVLERTTLIFAGDGSLRPRYEERVKELNLGKQVQFLGRVDSGPLMQQYRDADAFVLCSTAEGSPNVILEAMSFGVPVVTTRVGSAVNFVKDGETGFFIPFKDSQAIADRLTWLAGHPKERKEMGMKGYERVRARFSSEHNTAELRKILRI